MIRRAVRRGLGVLTLVAGTAAAQGAAKRPAVGSEAARDSARADSVRHVTRSGLIPAGFGSLKQDDIAIQVQNLGLLVKVLPLEESVIRTLGPDSYRALHATRERFTKSLDSLSRRLGLPSVQAWSVTFFNSEVGEARFDAGDIQIRSAGRDFRPLLVLPLKQGFGDGRLAQHTAQGAVYVFDPAIDLSQPITITIGTQTSSVWSDILQRVDIERALVWSRSGVGKAY